MSQQFSEFKTFVQRILPGGGYSPAYIDMLAHLHTYAFLSLLRKPESPVLCKCPRQAVDVSVHQARNICPLPSPLNSTFHVMPLPEL